jgi:exopolyphosphatase/guanosine-5'-triphosphate,3'-diphosphate pyrophosphatase
MIPKARPPLAVVDIGSNSARIVVYGREAAGHLRIIASARSSLRLVEGVVATKAIGEEAMARTAEALRDFRAIALGAGARAVRVYATAAVREATDGDQFSRLVARVMRAPLTILDGEAEATYGFHGALRGLDARDGLLFDLGGGSLQVTEFRHRERLRSWSVPLGALRLSRRYLLHDPATAREIKALRSHVDALLDGLPLREIGTGGRLVGTGGTVRNLAKIERYRSAIPGSRLHGHELSAESVAEIEAGLRRLPRRKRFEVLGLSKDRSDSIVAGAVVISHLLDRVDARDILVSGQGLREGLAYAALGDVDAPPENVRQTSIAALLSRFRGVDAVYAERRATLAAELFDRIVRDRGAAGERFAAALRVAATVLDIGRAVDFFDRHEHAARIVLASELDGYSQAEVARIAAILHAADEEGIDLDGYAPLVGRSDRAVVDRAAVILLLADDLLERAPRGATPRVAVTVRDKSVTIRAERVIAWRPRGLSERFARTFGRELIVSV